VVIIRAGSAQLSRFFAATDTAGGADAADPDDCVA
jgi:hypothetical protein